MQPPVTGGQLHVLQYLEIHVNVPQFEEILCKIKYLHVNVFLSYNRTVPFISVVNQLDAQNFCFTVSLFHASTCFKHMCSKHVEA